MIVAQYYANKDFIAKNLCENRSKPKLHCDGKCCLKKKLAKEGKEQAPGQRNQKEEQNITLFYSSERFVMKEYHVAVTPIKYFNFNELETIAYHGSVFHPPSA